MLQPLAVRHGFRHGINVTGMSAPAFTDSGKHTVPRLNGTATSVNVDVAVPVLVVSSGPSDAVRPQISLE